MPAVTIRGFEQLRRDVESLQKAIQDEALVAAEDAAAEAAKREVMAAAPRRSGQLARSVKVFESRERSQLTGQDRRRLLVGPEKKRGFYGYFLEAGWTATGRARRARTATTTTHSQRGVSGGRRIPGSGWFSRIAGTVEEAARRAGERAFQETIQRLIK